MGSPKPLQKYRKTLPPKNRNNPDHHPEISKPHATRKKNPDNRKSRLENSIQLIPGPILFNEMKRILPSIHFFIPTILALSVLTLSAWEQTGVASWYGGKFHGRITANGEVYDSQALTAAHKTLPFGSILTVTNLENGLKVRVRINDRGPFIDNRIIDLSQAAAKQIRMLKNGTAMVKLTANPEDIPETLFNIQVGAWKDFKRALNHRRKLERIGLVPHATLTSKGIIRVEIPNVKNENMNKIVKRIEQLGYTNLFIYQIYSTNR